MAAPCCAYVGPYLGGVEGGDLGDSSGGRWGDGRGKRGVRDNQPR